MTTETHAVEATIEASFILRQPPNGRYLGNDHKRMEEDVAHYTGIMTIIRERCAALGITISREMTYTGQVVMKCTEEHAAAIRTILDQEDLLQKPFTLPSKV